MNKKGVRESQTRHHSAEDAQKHAHRVAYHWMDKKPVLMFSTCQPPISANGEKVFVPQRVGNAKEMVETNSIHLEYTKWMRGVEVASPTLRGVHHTSQKP